MSVSLQGKHAARSAACVCACMYVCCSISIHICGGVFVVGWRVTAIIISVTHHCWGKERGEEELHSHAVERRGRDKKGLLDEFIQLNCKSLVER